MSQIALYAEEPHPTTISRGGLTIAARAGARHEARQFISAAAAHPDHVTPVLSELATSAMQGGSQPL